METQLVPSLVCSRVNCWDEMKVTPSERSLVRLSVRLMDLQLEAWMAGKKVQLLAHPTEKQWVKLKESCSEKSLVNSIEMRLASS